MILPCIIYIICSYFKPLCCNYFQTGSLIPAGAVPGQEIGECSLYLNLIKPDDGTFNTLNPNNRTITQGAKISEECEL